MCNKIANMYIMGMIEAQTFRLWLSGRTNKGRVQLKDDDGKVTDKAYEREYLAHDRKRIRRD